MKTTDIRHHFAQRPTPFMARAFLRFATAHTALTQRMRPWLAKRYGLSRDYGVHHTARRFMVAQRGEVY